MTASTDTPKAEPKTNRLTDLLAPWEALPDDAPEWDAVDSFVGELRSLANAARERQAENQRRKRTAVLERALHDLREAEEHGEQLTGEPLGIGAATWHTESCESSDIEEVALWVSHLCRDVLRYTELAQQIRTVPIGQRSALKRLQADLLDGEIAPRVELLAPLFNPSTSV